jgi:hypothetical protein
VANFQRIGFAIYVALYFLDLRAVLLCISAMVKTRPTSPLHLQLPQQLLSFNMYSCVFGDRELCPLGAIRELMKHPTFQKTFFPPEN